MKRFVLAAFALNSYLAFAAEECAEFLTALREDKVERYLLEGARTDSERQTLLRRLGLIRTNEFDRAFDSVLRDQYGYDPARNRRAIKVLGRLRKANETTLAAIGDVVLHRLERVESSADAPTGEMAVFSERARKFNLELGLSRWRPDYDRVLVKVLRNGIDERTAKLLLRDDLTITGVWTGLVALAWIAGELASPNVWPHKITEAILGTTAIGLAPSSALDAIRRKMRIAKSRRIRPEEFLPTYGHGVIGLASLVEKNPLDLDVVQLAYLGAVERAEIEKLARVFDPEALRVRSRDKINAAISFVGVIVAGRDTVENQVGLATSLNDLLAWVEVETQIGRDPTFKAFLDLLDRAYAHLEAAPFTAAESRIFGATARQATFIRTVLQENFAAMKALGNKAESFRGQLDRLEIESKALGQNLSRNFMTRSELLRHAEEVRTALARIERALLPLAPADADSTQ